MPKPELDCSIACPPANQNRLRAAQRVRAELAPIKVAGHSLSHEPGILSGDDPTRDIAAARKPQLARRERQQTKASRPFRLGYDECC
jgi:hypothetical protein